MCFTDSVYENENENTQYCQHFIFDKVRELAAVNIKRVGRRAACQRGLNVCIVLCRGGKRRRKILLRTVIVSDDGLEQSIFCV